MPDKLVDTCVPLALPARIATPVASPSATTSYRNSRFRPRANRITTSSTNDQTINRS